MDAAMSSQKNSVYDTKTAIYIYIYIKTHICTLITVDISCYNLILS